MKLTTLEIKGFKSFADKTTLHFNENITGIVGPNGCGKSNVVDAIRWVLGEQKPTAIRTEKMENLIFNGTKARKASGLAEVSLTFENTKNLIATEFSTVTISRHYFKTGDSEYRINGVSCRLKDIHSLFMDTGISSDSYAIIELGMLDDILHNKDNSRRKLFEQAAGISKYKARKKETLNKLSLTQLDLDRVEDILFEIENNLKELEKQAKKAQRHIKLKTDYKVISIDLCVLLMQSNKEIFKQLSNQQTYEGDIKSQIETDINTLEATIADKKTSIIEKEQTLYAFQKELNTLLDEIRLTENQSNISKERIKYLDEKQVSLNKSIQDFSVIIVQTNNEIIELEQTLSTELEKLNSTKQSLQSFLQELEIVKNEHATTKKKLEEEQNLFKQSEKDLYEIDKRIAVNKVRLENYHRELEQLDNDRVAQQNYILPLESELTLLNEEISVATNKLKILFDNDLFVKEKIQQATKSIESIKGELAEVRRNLDSKRNEFHLTKNLYESFEGFPESIKFLKKNVAAMEKAPLLSDIINPFTEYKQCIESFLDPLLNHYIVDEMSNAMYAIDALSKNEKGRANFLLLNEMQNKSRSKIKIEGTINAVDVLQFDSKYEALICYLLDSVFIISDENDFVRISESSKYKNNHLSFITQSGKVIKSDKSATGGSVGLFKGKRLGRESNIKKLGEEIDIILKQELEIQQSLKNQETKLDDLRKSIAEKEIRKASEDVNQLNQKLFGSQTKLDHVHLILKQISEKHGSFHHMIIQTETECADLNQKHQDIIIKKDKQQNILLEKETSYREISEKLNLHSNNYNQENIRYHQQLNRFDSVKQDLQYKIARFTEAQTVSDTNIQLLSEVAEELSKTKNLILSIENILIEKYNEKVVKESLVSRSEEAYYVSRGEIAETEDQIKSLQKKKDHSESIINGIKDKLNEIKIQLAAMKERLWIEFQIELEQIMDNELPQNTSLEELQEKVDAAKKRLENYGEVNPMAIQAYEEMKSRYDFIKDQREDLMSAKTSLLSTIEEIDITARKKFDDAFIQIRQNFQDVFRGLFSNEDDCDLILKENSDPLEAEIEIIAKPKGKKPQVLDQLSGGEKTLTGMSLLFALYLLKPAPFCILDEVDAPLDDHNISKFNHIIRKFSDNSQFIIVTHNKRTMAEVDIIYGVTMAEQGISKVVPVDFRNLN